MSSQFISQFDVLFQRLHEYHLKSESEVVEELLSRAEASRELIARSATEAKRLIAGVRKQVMGKSGVDALLNEYSLSSEEGVALMCLAEALLRIPDDGTSDLLIRDKIQYGEWVAHVGRSRSTFVNAATWGLVITGKALAYSNGAQQLQRTSKNLLQRLGDRGIRSAMRAAMGVMGNIFVMGESIESALKRARKFEAKGYRYSYDMLGEGARTWADAEVYFQSYQEAITAIGRASGNKGPVESPGISVKLSALHPKYHWSNRQRVLAELTPKLLELALQAKAFDIGLTVDAEEADRLELSLEVIGAVAQNPQLGHWQGFGFAVQAYQKRAVWVVRWAVELAKVTKRRLMVRLVKGAYWDTEIKSAQVDGTKDYPVYTRKVSTDLSYLVCAQELLASREWIYPQFASHNANTVAAILAFTEGDGRGFEFQRLHGMGDELYSLVIDRHSVACRIYAPVGNHTDLLAYLVRRLLENGANGSFVNNIVDANVDVDRLCSDPVTVLRSQNVLVNPLIKNPMALYGPERVNSPGINLADVHKMSRLCEGIDRAWQNRHSVAEDSESMVVRNPANVKEVVGRWRLDTAQEMLDKLAMVVDGFPEWNSASVNSRCEKIVRFIALLERDRNTLIMYCVKEAGKTIPDAIAEWREAVDFCRYYAQQAAVRSFDAHGYSGRGVVLCISPWNFPLAIFIGQVIAALAVGNTVLAKPAEQSSLIAQYTIELLHQAGFDKSVVQLVLATGLATSEHLVSDKRLATVMFTGSNATARKIQSQLSSTDAVPIPFIAETGGQNAMIVDSSALPEQVVDDVIRSGFLSAGQRCSALRVLYLQEDIADNVISMIKGAMDCLSIGDPSDLSVDVGPVIDRSAAEKLRNHIISLDGRSKVLHSCTLEPANLPGHFVAPTLFELDSITELKEEVFGPMVHVVRFSGAQLHGVIEEINTAGFGLTMGIHSRIQLTVEKIITGAEVGNIYVNRDMVGAVVGVQPFGGRGLSGTGPKAGGPNYQTLLVSKTLSSVAAPAESGSDPLLSLSYLAKQLAKFIVEGSMTPGELHRRFGTQINQLVVALTVPTVMPGPTGEDNRLEYSGKGKLIAAYEQSEDVEHFVVSCLMACFTGNRLDVFIPSSWKLWKERCSTLIDLLSLPGKAQYFISSPEFSVSQLSTYQLVVLPPGSRYQQAAQSAATLVSERILPLVSDPIGGYYGHRFIEEKTVTINTTAAGGNTSLMTLVEG